MKKHPYFLMLVLVLVGVVFSQQRKDENRMAITLCWAADFDTSARYMVYFNRYNTTDTAWRLISVTKDKSLVIAKDAFKGDIAFGVKAIYMGDTSAIHKSTDIDACANPPTDCDSNCSNGPWYMSWRLKAPKSIQYKK